MLLSHGIPWAFRVLIEKEPGRGRRYVHAGRGITISGEWQEDLQHGYGVEVWEGNNSINGYGHYQGED
eukprot:g7386.t1